MINALKNLLVNEDGATLVEYGLIVALIAVAAIAAIGALGTAVISTFGKITAKL